MTEVPIIQLGHLTEAQRRALVIADNQLALDAGWSEETLHLELQALQEADFDLMLIGFDNEELARLLAEQDTPAAGEDDVPEIPDTLVTIPGDLWLLDGHKGRPLHRVLCGDATAGDATMRLLAGQKPPFIMTTDPPYGVNLEPEWREEVGLNPRTRQGGKVSNDDRVNWSAAYTLFPGDVAYVWHAGIHAGEVAVGLHSCKFRCCTCNPTRPTKAPLPDPSRTRKHDASPHKTGFPRTEPPRSRFSRCVPDYQIYVIGPFSNVDYNHRFGTPTEPKRRQEPGRVHL